MNVRAWKGRDELTKMMVVSVDFTETHTQTQRERDTHEGNRGLVIIFGFSECSWIYTVIVIACALDTGDQVPDATDGWMRVCADSCTYIDDDKKHV